jgi:hypothetical protein
MNTNNQTKKINWFYFGLSSIAFLAINLVHAQTNKNDLKVFFVSNNDFFYDQNNMPRKDVLFGTLLDKSVVHYKKNGLSYQFSKFDNSNNHGSDVIPAINNKSLSPQTFQRIDLEWLGSNENVRVIGTNQTAKLTGDDYLDWKLKDQNLFTDLIYNELYNGINLHYYEKNGVLKYDFELEPGSNFEDIKIRVKGAEVTILNNGKLQFQTELGIIEEDLPIVIQNGKTLPSTWVLKDNVVSFHIENYDPNKKGLIDPIIRDWGTYYGGEGYDNLSDMQMGFNNQFFAVGKTSSNNPLTIATTGSYQNTCNGDSDIFLACFDTNGNRIWATYIGGSGDDWGNDLAIDNTGSIYIVGSTSNGNFPTTNGAYQTTYAGGNYDVILCKFSQTGTLLWSTLYGGSGWDAGFACEVDQNNNICIVGQTESNDNSLTTQNCHQSIFNGGISDGFMSMFDENGNRLWSTYIGGEGYDLIGSICKDNQNNFFLSGFTSTEILTNTIASLNGFQTSLSGQTDALLMKFDNSGNRIWGTYYGSPATENSFIGYSGYPVECDQEGNVYIGGAVSNPFNDPSVAIILSSPNAHQTSFGGISDAFLAKFNPNGQRLWGTLYGGIGVSSINDIRCGENGNVYAVGESSDDNSNSIVTVGAYKSNAELGDLFVVSFNSDGVRLAGTFYGSESYERDGFCVLNNDNTIILGGTTLGLSQIASNGAFQTDFNGNEDSFFAKLANIDITQIEETKNEYAKVYPNPFSETIFIELKKKAIVEIISITGEILESFTKNIETHTIDLSRYPQGTYLVRISTHEGETTNYKVVKN